MSKSILALLSLLASAIASAASLNLTADTTSRIQNPERGFYFHVTSGESCGGFAQSLRDGGTLSQPVSIVYYDVNPVSSSTSTFNSDLACLRDLGLKVYLNFSYCSASNCDEGRTSSQVLGDISTWAPYVQANKDVIAFIRASFIGAWGEWVSNAGSPDSSRLDYYPNKVSIRDALMSHWPPEIPLLFRGPYHTLQWYGNLTASTANKGSNASRAGFHNDCAMASADDGYTYPGAYTYNGASISSTVNQQREHVENNSTWVVNGWETCQQSGQERLACTGGVDNYSPPRAGGVMNEGPRQHLTFIHRGYYLPFMDAWISGGCYDTVDAMLGYRITISNISHADTVTKGSTLVVTVKLRNTGWGPVSRERRLASRLVMGGQPDIPCTSSAQDLRSLPPQSTTDKAFKIKCPVPADAVSGSRSVRISAPDAAPSLNPPLNATAVRHYKVKFANTATGGVTWDDTLGEIYGTTVSVP